MFRFHWNHHQALLQKYIDPLHKIVKMRYGIPDAYIEPVFTIHMSLFSYCSIWTSVLELKTLRTRYANVSCAYKMSLKCF